MFVLIAGGGRTGAQLAALLLSENYKIRLVEHRPEILARLHQELPTESIYEGEPSDPDVLEAAGIRQAHALAATTTDDAANLSLCFIARKLFGVPRTIARVNNPRNAWLFNENFHVDVALNQANVLAHLIQEEMSLGDMMTLLKIRHGRYSLVEEKVEKGASAIGVALKDLGLPEECIIAAIIRDGQVTLPRGMTAFQEWDEVLAITTPEGALQLAHLLSAESHPHRDEEKH
ncbi:MAG: potassium transporter TrkA [Chloroflexi bacterium RIFOXYC12_FULL_59_14]|nr:MAG: potassium transporter TrkA [Chloroflexi bacterium RIFOXYC12_FULL_59_14]